MVSTSHNALRRTAFVVNLACALGESQRLSTDVYTEMDDCRRLFAAFSLKIPYRVTFTEEFYFSKMKKPVQELAIQCMNVLRFHEDVEDITESIMNTSLPAKLSKEALDKALFLTDAFPSVFDLDANNLPKSVLKGKAANCPLKAFEQHMLLRYVFVDNMEQFRNTPAPRKPNRTDFGLRAKSQDFHSKIYVPNIVFAF